MLRTVLATMLALAAVPAAAQTITKAEIRSQPIERTDEQLKDQLWGIFVPEDRRSRDPAWPPRQVLEGVNMQTRPYPVEGGLCRRDRMQLRFAPTPPVEREKADAQTPVRAYGIDVWQVYRLVEFIDQERYLWRDSNWMQRGWEICATQASEHFIGAPSDSVATAALYALHRGTRDVAGGRIMPTCAKVATEEGSVCMMAYDRTIENKPAFVNECDLGTDNFLPHTCFTIQYPLNMLIFRGTSPFSAEGIMSVEISGISLIDDSYDVD